MRGLLAAFSTIWAVTAVGWLIGRFGLLGREGENVLARLVFFIATPALLFDTLATAELRDIVTPALAVFVLSTVTVAAMFLLWARLAWRRSTGETVVGTMAASYVNAANLGLPVAAYALGDVAFAVPVLLFQLLLAGPAALAVLEMESRKGRAALVLAPLRNPIMLSAAAGLAVSVSGWDPPEELLRPFALVGAAAVPLALLALGVSLGGPRPVGEGTRNTQVRWMVVAVVLAVVVALKVLVQPLLAYAIGRALGLDGRMLLAAVVTSGLPTAQNVFVYAVRYGKASWLARDAVVVSTVLTAPSLVLIALWLG